jgi:hypothetical protein
MSSLFDTHAAVQKLKEAGFSEHQAEAQVQMVAEALQSNLATKADVERLSHAMALLEERSRGRFTLLQWMIGFNIALTAAVLAKLLI